MRLFGSLLVPIALNLHTSPSSRRIGTSISRCVNVGQGRTRLSRWTTTTRARKSTMGNNHDHSQDKPIQQTIVHCNHAGASPSPPSVLSTVWEHMQLEQIVGGYTAAERAEEQLQTVYDRVAQLLGLRNTNSTSTTYNSRHEIALVESATVGWTRLFYSMARYQHQRRQQQQLKQHPQPPSLITLPTPPPSPPPLVILVSEAEYAANVVAACQWAQDHPPAPPTTPGWTVLALPSSRNTDGTSTGKVSLQILEEMLQGTYQYSSSTYNSNTGDDVVATLDPSNIAMVCVTHIPTNGGLVNDVEGIGHLIAQYNQGRDKTTTTTTTTSMPSILYLVDACQSVGQRPVDVLQIQCHGLVATGRKFLRGPRGTGFLYLPLEIANQLPPHHVDHFGVPIVAVPNQSALTSSGSGKLPVPIEDVVHFRPKPGASRFEFYESNVANKLGLGEAIRYAMEDVGIDVIQSTLVSLAHDLYQRLQAMPKVTVHHPPESGIVTFYVATVPSQTIREELWDCGNDSTTNRIQFETSLVPATSTPLDSSQSGVPDMVRVSLTYTNTILDLDELCEKLTSILSESRMR